MKQGVHTSNHNAVTLRQANHHEETTGGIGEYPDWFDQAVNSRLSNSGDRVESLPVRFHCQPFPKAPIHQLSLSSLNSPTRIVFSSESG
jgi:hypothetical protein